MRIAARLAITTALGGLSILLLHRHQSSTPEGQALARAVAGGESAVPAASAPVLTAAAGVRPAPAAVPAGSAALAAQRPVLPAQAPAFRYPDEPPPAVPGLPPAERAALVTDLMAKSTADQAAAKAWATQRGLPVKGDYPDGGGWELMGFDEMGQPRYYTTNNVNAAISNGVRPRMVNSGVRGHGMTAGVWDKNLARITHREFGDGSGNFFVTPGDRGAGLDVTNLVFSSHATHVTGTIVANGIDPLAQGMAPQASALTYSWNGDLGEMTSVGATYSGEPGRIYVSNHSYGDFAGWSFITHTTAQPAPGGVTGFYWSSADGQVEDWKFGAYEGYARSWDETCRTLPYLLPFKSAGNDRGDGPGPGAPSFVWRAGAWTQITTALPQADGGTTGYDTLPTFAVAKNIMTVGAVNDAVANGVRSPSSATMSSFSGWGPAALSSTTSA